MFFLVKILKGTSGKFYDHNGSNLIHFESDKFGIKIAESFDGCEILVDDYFVFIDKKDLFQI